MPCDREFWGELADDISPHDFDYADYPEALTEQDDSARHL